MVTMSDSIYLPLLFLLFVFLFPLILLSFLTHGLRIRVERLFYLTNEPLFELFFVSFLFKSMQPVANHPTLSLSDTLNSFFLPHLLQFPIVAAPTSPLDMSLYLYPLSRPLAWKILFGILRTKINSSRKPFPFMPISNTPFLFFLLLHLPLVQIYDTNYFSQVQVSLFKGQ